MNMDISSKFTLYDLLAMVIPGFLILMLFLFGANWQFVFFENWVNILYVIIICYVIGMIYRKAIEFILGKINFRNNEKHIKKSAEKFYRDYEENGGKIGNNPRTDKHRYYKAYYALMKNGMLYNIPTLEAQVAFICSILPIIPFYILLLIFHADIFLHINHYISAMLLLISAVILIFVLISIQNKIYYLVWEGNEYLKDIEEESSKTGNHKIVR
jgi:hypothetical protein